MVKGVNDKQSGFWMYLQQVVQPYFARYERRRIFGEELKNRGSPMWSALSEEEKQMWKDRAKAYNTSHAGRAEQKKRREALRERKNRIAEPFTQLIHSGAKVKPSLIMPASRRVDEIDQLAKVYFEPSGRDYMWKREHDVKELADQYTWRLTQRPSDLPSDYKKAFFLDKPMWIAAVNLYYQDGQRMIPSEISLVKFNIRDGFEDQRNFILALPYDYIPPEYCEDDAVYNEEKTAIRADGRGNRLIEVMRTDFDRVWDEIKEFTDLDGDEQKIFVCADQWNEVVGSFQTLYSAVNETAFSRVETRFIAIDDFFMAMAMTLLEMECTEEMRVCVSTEMHEKWPGTIEFDRVTCSYHYQFRYRNECQSRSCSMFTAHEAIFNFFTLCKKYVFCDYEFTGNHLPNKAQLPQLESDYQECGTSSMAPAQRSGPQTTVVNSRLDVRKISGYAFDRPERFKEPAVYRTRSGAGFRLMRESKVRSDMDLIQLVEEPRDKLASNEGKRGPYGSFRVSTGNVQHRCVEPEARLNELASEPSTPNPIPCDEGDDFSHTVNRIEEVTREPLMVVGPSNASDSSRRARFRESPSRKNRSKSAVSRFSSDADFSAESSGRMSRPSTALSHVSAGGHVLEEFDPLFARRKSHQTLGSNHTTYKSSAHSSAAAFLSDRLETEPSYDRSSIFRKTSENSQQSGLHGRLSAGSLGSSVRFGQSYQTTIGPEFRPLVSKLAYDPVECQAGDVIPVLSGNMRGLDLGDHSDFSVPGDDALSRARIPEVERLTVNSNPRVPIASLLTNQQQAITQSNIISDEATFDQSNETEVHPSSSMVNAQRLPFDYRSHGIPAGENNADFVASQTKIRGNKGRILEVSPGGMFSPMYCKYRQNSSTTTANNSSIKIRNDGPPSSAGMLTRAATALPVNPSSWYINRGRTKDMAIGQDFLTSDGSPVGQQADVDTTRQTSTSSDSGKDMIPCPVRLKYKDAADYGWISRTKLPGANGWASSMGGRLVQNVQRYGHNTSNIGFGPFNH